MSGWVKYACFAVSMISFVDCYASNNSRSIHHDFQLIDAHQKRVIRLGKVCNYVFLSTDSNFKRSERQSVLPSWMTINNRLETDPFDSEKVKIFNFQGLPYAEIQDLKIAVDDYRIINYLNPDF